MVRKDIVSTALGQPRYQSGGHSAELTWSDQIIWYIAFCYPHVAPRLPERDIDDFRY
jgi:hypothetical protein